MLTLTRRAPSEPGNRLGGWLPSLGIVLVIFLMMGGLPKVATLVAERGPAALRPSAANLAAGGVASRSEKVATSARRHLGTSFEIGLLGRRDMTDWLLTCRAYGSVGVTLPKSAAEQARKGKPVRSLKVARRGDLLGWDTSKKRTGITHVAVYMGGGRMIDAPGSGEAVREIAVARYGPPDVIRRLV